MGPARHAVRAALLFLLAAVLGPGVPAASAAAPTIGSVWVSSVQSTTTRLHAEVDPGGVFSTYHFDYLTGAAYEANLSGGKDGFSGAARLPAGSDASIPTTSPTTVGPLLSGLQPGTAYRYRLVVKNADGSATSTPRAFNTHAPNPGGLPDGRGWEMVSPVDKNGGEVEPPEGLAGGGVLQAAAGGGGVTYGSGASFGVGAQGAAVASQYLASRSADGWSTLNITAPLLSGSYGSDSDGVPYQLFSGDLARGLLLSGRPCRGEATGCPVANPPLPGTDAPAGYQNYYLREAAAGAFEALLGAPDVAGLALDPGEFELRLAGASPDLRHAVLSTCAALTPGASEVPLGEGCDPAKPNLYVWSAGSLSLINATPGAALAAQSGAISTDGTRIYWQDLDSGNLYLRDGSQTEQADLGAGGGGDFETASADGATALYSKAGHLWRYDAVSEQSTDLTPSGGVTGVLGASQSASRAYYLTAAGLFLRDGATTAKVADAADASNYPPTTGTARVSADGTKLLFLSSASLTGYDNIELGSGNPTSQVYRYDAAGGGLACVSCNPTGARPLGPSSIPGSIANGQGTDATDSYKPRALSADGRRVFFESDDALVLADVNLGSDVYQWEAEGTGSCTRAGGCVALISSGLADHANFVDASADGSDVFFLTGRSLVGADPGAIDLYDARIGGGFPEPVEPTPCIGDACQVVPPSPENPILTTQLPGPGNPAVRYGTDRVRTKKCPKGKKRKTVKGKNGKKVKRCVGVAGKKGKRGGKR